MFHSFVRHSQFVLNSCFSIVKGEGSDFFLFQELKRTRGNVVCYAKDEHLIFKINQGFVNIYSVLLPKRNKPYFRCDLSRIDTISIISCDQLGEDRLNLNLSL